MKKLFAVVLILIGLSCVSEAKTYKLMVQTLTPFASENPKNIFKMQILANYPIKDYVYLERGTIIIAEVTNVEPPQRGKKDAFFNVKFKYMIVPSTKRKIKIYDRNLEGKITAYKKVDKKEASIKAGVSVVGMFVKNITYPISFARGFLKPYPGKGRIASGVQKVYKDSALSYLDEGAQLTLKKGSLAKVIVKTEKINKKTKKIEPKEEKVLNKKLLNEEKTVEKIDNSREIIQPEKIKEEFQTEQVKISKPNDLIEIKQTEAKIISPSATTEISKQEIKPTEIIYVEEKPVGNIDNYCEQDAKY